MEPCVYNELVKKIIEKEQRDDLYAKRIRECEAAIKSEEENIKQLNILKSRLKEDLEKKILENSKAEIAQVILQQEKLIWTDLLKNAQSNLKEEEGKLEALQQSICLNRLSFCDSTKGFIEKLDLLEATHGFYKDRSSSSTPAKVVTKEETEEYKSLLETKYQLEKELEELKNKEEQIEEAKRYKLQLQAEPSCGENFLSLQQSLKDMKDELLKMDTQIRKVKNDISQKELLLLKKNYKKNEAVQIHTNQSREGFKRPTEDRNILQQPCTSASKVPNLQRNMTTMESQTSTKVSFQNFTSSKRSTQETSSPNMRQEKSLKLTSRLDEKMKGILFNENE